MIGTWKYVLLVTATSSAIAAFILWRTSHESVKVTTNGLIVADISDSVVNDPASIIGLAHAFLSKRKLASGSTLNVITTGDDESAGEPRLVGEYEVPFSRRALEGRSSVTRRKKEILADLETKLAQVRQTKRSPIFLAVKRGIEELRADGCSQETNCFLYVKTDGEELAETAIKQAIEGPAKTKLPSAISNEGITVTFCGLSETSASGDGGMKKIHDVRRGDRLRQVWLSLFTVPDLVTFEPYCPKAHVEAIAAN